MAFLLNTRCKIDNKMRAFLIKTLGNKPVMSKLLYSGSVHGWKYENFHSMCDWKENTISLFQIDEGGDCIGGYTSQKWESSEKWKADQKAFLFNLTRYRLYRSKATGTDIYCNGDIGPCFTGEGSVELVASNEPFNGKRMCRSNAN
jgi:hypothetical protein